VYAIYVVYGCSCNELMCRKCVGYMSSVEEVSALVTDIVRGVAKLLNLQLCCAMASADTMVVAGTCEGVHMALTLHCSRPTDTTTQHNRVSRSR
jgi:hypothetical protein